MLHLLFKQQHQLFKIVKYTMAHDYYFPILRDSCTTFFLWRIEKFNDLENHSNAFYKFINSKLISGEGQDINWATRSLFALLIGMTCFY